MTFFFSQKIYSPETKCRIRDTSENPFFDGFMAGQKKDCSDSPTRFFIGECPTENKFE